MPLHGRKLASHVRTPRQSAIAKPDPVAGVPHGVFLVHIRSQYRLEPLPENQVSLLSWEPAALSESMLSMAGRRNQSKSSSSPERRDPVRMWNGYRTQWAVARQAVLLSP